MSVVFIALFVIAG